MKRIVFRTMGGEKIGYGHYYRCLSLADGLLHESDQIDIEFIVNKGLQESVHDSIYKYVIIDDFNDDILVLKELKPDIVIFDSYLANDEYLEKIAQISKLVMIDDNNDIYDSTIPDVIINGNIHADELTYKKRNDGIYLFGTDYLVMKQEYWNLQEYESDLECTKNQKMNILITTGGSDLYKLSLKILETLLKTNYKKTIIIGPSYSKDLIEKLEHLVILNTNINLIYKPNSLKKHINNADLIITAGGSTVYEILSQKRIPMIFSLADNQDLVCKKLEENGIPYIGKYPNINYDSIVKKLNRIVERYNKDLNFSIFIDGQGAIRVAQVLLKIM